MICLVTVQSCQRIRSLRITVDQRVGPTQLKAEDETPEPEGEHFRQREAERRASREKLVIGIVNRQYLYEEGLVVTEYEGED